MIAQSLRLDAIEKIHPGPRTVNVSAADRYGSLFGGGMLVAAGVQKRSATGALIAALGTELIRRGVTGHCRLYDALHISTADPAPLHVVGSILVARPAGELYAYWRDFSRHPRFMVHLESVVTNEGRTHWTMAGPLRSHIEWDTEVTEELSGRRIAWRTIEGSQLPHRSVVTFDAAPGGRGTIVRVEVAYEPRATAAAIIGKLLGYGPQTLLDQDLRRFRQLMETGELATLEGQSHGSRSKGLGALFRAVERPAMPAPESKASSQDISDAQYVEL